MWSVIQLRVGIVTLIYLTCMLNPHISCLLWKLNTPVVMMLRYNWHCPKAPDTSSLWWCRLLLSQRNTGCQRARLSSCVKLSVGCKQCYNGMGITNTQCLSSPSYCMTHNSKTLTAHTKLNGLKLKGFHKLLDRSTMYYGVERQLPHLDDYFVQSLRVL